jgi:hypothetical protein
MLGIQGARDIGAPIQKAFRSISSIRNEDETPELAGGTVISNYSPQSSWGVHRLAEDPH